MMITAAAKMNSVIYCIYTTLTQPKYKKAMLLQGDHAGMLLF